MYFIGDSTGRAQKHRDHGPCRIGGSGRGVWLYGSTSCLAPHTRCGRKNGKIYSSLATRHVGRKATERRRSATKKDVPKKKDFTKQAITVIKSEITAAMKVMTPAQYVVNHSPKNPK